MIVARRLASAAAFIALVALAVPSFAQPNAQPGVVPPSAPTLQPGPPSLPPAPSAQPAAPGLQSAAPSVQPAPSQTGAQRVLTRFTGQLLDVRNGYAYFTTGDAFKLAAAARIADLDSGQPTTVRPRAKMFARATFDPATKDVIELDVTSRRLPAETAYAEVKQFSQTKPTTVNAPEIAGQRITGKEVPVEFVVTVPPSTALTDPVYLATDVSGWNPQAIRLDRVDAQRYRTVQRLSSGTHFVFRVTRGSWSSVEVGQDGLEPAPHDFFIREVASQSQGVTVYAWSDNRSNSPQQQQAQPGAIPTPYNPNPFPPGGLFPPSRATPPGGFPTPRPGIPNPPR